VQKKGYHRRVLLPDLPIVLLPGGQGRKGSPEMALGIAIKALPLPEQGQGYHLTPAQGRLRAWVGGRERKVYESRQRFLTA